MDIDQIGGVIYQPASDIDQPVPNINQISGYINQLQLRPSFSGSGVIEKGHFALKSAVCGGAGRLLFCGYRPTFAGYRPNRGRYLPTGERYRSAGAKYQPNLRIYQPTPVAAFFFLFRGY
ncbi:hypothetical protein [Mesobacillus zeae]|uniref:hypothetical protein n=1 Tax=Mesobacillus zeae TaxID=1917180 RepID=UPI0015E66C9C|nr:hypothetical protein [Mesobacillus zeae]